MGYVGRGLNQDGGQYRKLDSIATSFNGSETNFSLTIDGLEVTPTAQNLMISLGGVVQEPGTAFTVNGSTITFASAPADATTFFGVLMGEATFIARGTVGAAEMGITSGAVSASAGVVVDSSKNVIGFNEISASIFKGSFSGDTSSSINTRINSLVTDSGSFSTRITNATASINSISSSQATRTANLVIASSSLSASVATLKGSGTLQSVATNASPTFAGATITGTLTAQEIHTEFESASIIFSSGSTIFGDTSDDIHRMTGSLNVSGALNLNDGDAVFGATATVETGLNLESGTFTVKNATSDSNGLKISQGGSDASNILNHYNGTLNLGVSNSVDMTLKGGSVGIGTDNPSFLLSAEAADGVMDNKNVVYIENKEATAGRNYGLYVKGGTNSSDANMQLVDTSNNSLLFIRGDGNVGIGIGSPVSKIDVRGASSTIALNTDATAVFTLDPPDVSNGTYLFGDGSSGGDQVQILAVNDSAANLNEYAGIGFAMKTSGNTVATLAGVAGIKENDTDGSGGDVGALAFGTRATGDYVKEHMRINSSGNVGIGTNAPLTAIHVHGDAGDPASSGTTPTAIARFGTAGLNAVLDIGQGASPYPMFLQSADRSNLAQFYELSLNPVGGNVGIGTLNPGTALEVHSDGNSILTLNADRTGTSGQDNAGIYLENQNSSVWAIRYSSGDANRLEIYDAQFDDGVQLAQGGSGFSDISDERAKTDLVTITDAVDKINSLRAVNFKWKYGNEERRTKNNVGIIAQDVYKVLPEAVYIPENDYKVVDHPIYEGEKQAQNLWTVDKSKLTILLIKAVQELTKRIEELEK